jgi:hypothetical protein
LRAAANDEHIFLQVEIVAVSSLLAESTFDESRGSNCTVFTRSVWLRRTPRRSPLCASQIPIVSAAEVAMRRPSAEKAIAPMPLVALPVSSSNGDERG